MGAESSGFGGRVHRYTRLLMRTSVEPLEGNLVKLRVEVDDDEVAEAESRTLNRLTREARIPGFRPGKAPRPRDRSAPRREGDPRTGTA